MEQSTVYGELKAQYKRQSHSVRIKGSVTDTMNTFEKIR